MTALRGQRFDIELSSDDDDGGRGASQKGAGITTSLVADIQERPIVPAAKAIPPTMKNHSSGFPAHTKRTPQSRFKTRREAARDEVEIAAAPGSPVPRPRGEAANAGHQRAATNERTDIDLENRQRLASMSEEEIAREREELIKSLDPIVLQGLLHRAQVTEPISKSDNGVSVEAAQSLSKGLPRAKRVTFQEISTGTHTSEASKDEKNSVATEEYLPSGVHFPKAPQPEDLDPNDSGFLDSLHSKYFPSLPSEPSKLSWMRSSSESAYKPEQTSVRIAELRFDFQGALIAPRKAASIPVTAGLHHHGDAPDSAGYTVPELAHLSRSSVPMQRCIAFQTLGRLMFRLGHGGFGEADEAIPKGLWRMLKEGRVLDTLQEAAKDGAGHLSAKVHATEALWLWQRGGGAAIDAV